MLAVGCRKIDRWFSETNGHIWYHNLFLFFFLYIPHNKHTHTLHSNQNLFCLHLCTPMAEEHSPSMAKQTPPMNPNPKQIKSITPVHLQVPKQSEFPERFVNFCFFILCFNNQWIYLLILCFVFMKSMEL